MFEDILFGFVAFLVVLFVQIKRKNVKQTTNLPPGPKPVTLLGNTLLYFKMHDIQGGFQLIENIIGDHGIVYVNVLVVGKVIFCGKAEYVESVFASKECLDKSELFYEKATSVFDGLVVISGDKWKQHRKLLNPVFSTKNLKTYTQIFSKMSYQVCEELKTFADGKTNIECVTAFRKPIFSSLIESLCGVTELPFSEEFLEQFFTATEKQVDQSSESFLKLYTDPIRRYFWFNDTPRQFKAMAKKMAYNLLEQFNKHYNNDSKYEDGIKRCDMNYLQRAASLPGNDFVAEMNTAIVAEQVYKEVRDILGDTERAITMQDLSQMKFLEACINETLRLYPVIPLVVRKTTTEIPIGQYTASENTHIVIMLTTLHRDPEQWEKPNEFYPQHFEPDKVKKRHSYAFAPFAAGPRQCIGYRYAMLSLKSMLAVIVKNFQIHTDIKFSEVFINRALMTDPTGLTIKLKPREHHTFSS